MQTKNFPITAHTPESAGVRVIRPGDRTPDPITTSGMTREQAVLTNSQWSGYIRTPSGMTSGWHHHGDYDTTIYVVAGAIRIETSQDGQAAVEGQPGDFIFLPKGTIHRESNPSTVTGELVVTRVGSGIPTVNVDGPAAPS